MKLVYSHWSSPRSMTVDLRITFCLSVLVASRRYPRIELITDSTGARLVERLQLPFTGVRTDLDHLDVSPLAWASGKLMAYSLQEEPFIHLDQDVFLFRRLPERLHMAPILAQSPEPRGMYDVALAHAPLDLVRGMTLPSDDWGAYNAGILGGTDVGFLHDYARRALDAIRTVCTFHPVTMTMYEQAFLARAARDAGKRVEVLMQDDSEAESLGYTHLMNAKQRVECMSRVRRRLEREDPDLFSRAVLAPLE